MRHVVLSNSGGISKKDNFHKTVLLGVSAEEIEQVIERDDYLKLKNHYGSKSVKIWGLTATDVNGNTISENKKTLKKIQKNDIFLYCTSNNYHHKTKVVHKLNHPNPALSKLLWGNDKYSLIVFLDEILPLNISRQEIQSTVGMPPNQYTFNPKYLGDIESQKLINNYLNVQNVNGIVNSLNNDKNTPSYSVKEQELKNINEFEDENIANTNKLKNELNINNRKIDSEEKNSIFYEENGEYISNEEKNNQLSKEEVAVGGAIETFVENESIQSFLKVSSENNEDRDKFELGEENGKMADSDRITSEDKLDREKVVNSFYDFYTEYTLHNKAPFFTGVFAEWGKGKSSFIEMIKDKINEKPKESITHVVSKIDCSLIDQKDILWVSILTQVIDDVEIKKSHTKFLKGFLMRWNFKKKWNFKKFNIIKTEFDLRNLFKVIWMKKGILFIWVLLSILAIYFINPANGLAFDKGKDIAGWISLIVLVVSVIKNLDLKLNKILLPSSNMVENSSYFKSKYEYQQLITILDKSLKKSHQLRILIVLDEIDRMNKNLFEDLIEIIQLFKSIQNHEKNNNNVTLDFLFSFNHQIVFPIIGNAVSLGNDELLINSLSGKMKTEKGEINKFKLGKDYMDKYLDLSIYLDNQVDFSAMLCKVFDVPNWTAPNNRNGEDDDSFQNNKDSSLSVKPSDKSNDAIRGSEPSIGPISETETQMGDSTLNDETPKTPTFSKDEVDIIWRHTNHIDPRKLTRLKNSLLFLRMINRNEDFENLDQKQYLEEVEYFVSLYLEHEENLRMKGKEFRYLKDVEYIMGKHNS